MYDWENLKLFFSKILTHELLLDANRELSCTSASTRQEDKDKKDVW